MEKPKKSSKNVVEVEPVKISIPSSKKVLYTVITDFFCIKFEEYQKKVKT